MLEGGVENGSLLAVAFSVMWEGGVQKNATVVID